MGKPKKPRKRPIHRLPEDVMESIALKLYEAADLLRFSMISKHWYNHIHSNSFWERHPASSRLMLCCINSFSNFHCLHLPHDLPTSYDDLPDSTIYKWFNNLNLHPFTPEMIRNVASSDGLLCIQYLAPTNHHEDAEIIIYNTYIHLFDPFRSSDPLKVLRVPDNSLAVDETPGTLHFKVYSLTHTYIIILGITKEVAGAFQRGYLIYRSSTRKWEKSQVIKISSYSSDGEVFMGDSLYFVHGLRYIHKYTLSTESWSKKQIAKRKAPEVVTNGMGLFFKEGKLMIIAPADEKLHAWKAVEKKHKYIFTEISLHETSYDYGAYFYYWPDYDLVLIQLVARETESENLVRELTVYRPSTNSWHYIDRPANFKGNHYFVSETKWLFIRPLQ